MLRGWTTWLHPSAAHIHAAIKDCNVNAQFAAVVVVVETSHIVVDYALVAVVFNYLLSPADRVYCARALLRAGASQATEVLRKLWSLPYREDERELAVCLMRYGAVPYILHAHFSNVWARCIPTWFEQLRHLCCVIICCGRRSRITSRDAMRGVARALWAMRWDYILLKTAIRSGE